jgi:hypothetical protein
MFHGMLVFVRGKSEKKNWYMVICKVINKKATLDESFSMEASKAQV